MSSRRPSGQLGVLRAADPLGAPMGGTGAQALRGGGLSAPGRTRRRGCARGAPARGSAVARSRGRGRPPPGHSRGAARAMAPRARRVDLAAAPEAAGGWRRGRGEEGSGWAPRSYFGSGWSRAGQLLLAAGQGVLPRPLAVAGCMSARGRAGKGRSCTSVSGGGRSFSCPAGTSRGSHAAGRLCSGLPAKAPLRPGCESQL